MSVSMFVLTDMQLNEIPSLVIDEIHYHLDQYCPFCCRVSIWFLPEVETLG